MNAEENLWLAPAKLNLMLRVVGRRKDGYHELQTVFQFLEQSDRLRFRVSRSRAIRCVTPLPGVAEADNLAIRAARLLQQASGVSRGVELEVYKSLPMGGGLGGGSSNAATTLLVLNHLWGCRLDTTQLAELGRQLGADVPIFIHGRAAWAEGIGERLTPLAPPEPWYLVVRPPCHVSTAEIFSHPRLTRNATPIKIRDFLAGEADNTCEPLVRSCYPQVDRALSWLGRHTRGRLTGTGSCVFGEFANREAATAALRELPDEMEGFVSRGQNLSPLHRQLQQFDGVSPSG